MAPFVKGKVFCRSQVIMTNINVANPFPPHLPIGDFTLSSPSETKTEFLLTSYENNENYQLEDYWFMQYQILQIFQNVQTNIVRIVCQTVRRDTSEILGYPPYFVRFSNNRMVPNTLG